MVNLLSGLLGGISGASNAVNTMAQNRQKELADQLKMQAIQEYEIAAKAKEHGYRTAENEQQGKIQTGIHSNDRASAEKIAAERNVAERGIHELDNKSRSEDRRFEAEMRHQDRMLALEDRKLSRQAAEGKGAYSHIQQVANPDGSGGTILIGVKRDGSGVEQLAFGGDKDPNKTRKNRTDAVIKFREAVSQGNYEDARLIAKDNDIPVKDVSEIIATHWFSPDETRKRPEIDSSGLLGSNMATPAAPSAAPAEGKQVDAKSEIGALISRGRSNQVEKAPAAKDTIPQSSQPSAPAQQELVLGSDGETIWDISGEKTVRVMVKPSETLYNGQYPNPEYQKYLDLLSKAKKTNQ